MIKLEFNDYSRIETKITIPPENQYIDAFEAIYKFWTSMGYSEDTFTKACEQFIQEGDLMFYS